MITWNDLSVGEREALQAIQFRKVVNVFADAMRLAGMELIKVDTENPTTFLLLTDAGRAVLAQKPANDSGAAVDGETVLASKKLLQQASAKLTALQAENASLQRELEAARTAVADVNGSLDVAETTRQWAAALDAVDVSKLSIADESAVRNCAKKLFRLADALKAGSDE